MGWIDQISQDDIASRHWRESRYQHAVGVGAKRNPPAKVNQKVASFDTGR